MPTMFLPPRGESVAAARSDAQRAARQAKCGGRRPCAAPRAVGGASGLPCKGWHRAGPESEPPRGC